MRPHLVHTELNLLGARRRSSTHPRGGALLLCVPRPNAEVRHPDAELQDLRPTVPDALVDVYDPEQREHLHLGDRGCLYWV